MTTNDQLILSEFLQQRKVDIAKEMDESKFFELFVSEQILKDLDLSWDELEEGVVGAGGDGGIDSLFHLWCKDGKVAIKIYFSLYSCSIFESFNGDLTLDC